MQVGTNINSELFLHMASKSHIFSDIGIFVTLRAESEQVWRSTRRNFCHQLTSQQPQFCPAFTEVPLARRHARPWTLTCSSHNNIALCSPPLGLERLVCSSPGTVRRRMSPAKLPLTPKTFPIFNLTTTESESAYFHVACQLPNSHQLIIISKF